MRDKKTDKIKKLDTAKENLRKLLKDNKNPSGWTLMQIGTAAITYSNALSSLSKSEQFEDRLHAVDSLLSDVIATDERAHQPQAQLKDKMNRKAALTPSQHSLQKVFVSMDDNPSYLKRAFRPNGDDIKNLSLDNLAVIEAISKKIAAVKELYKKDGGYALPGGLDFGEIRLPEGIEYELLSPHHIKDISFSEDGSSATSPEDIENMSFSEDGNSTEDDDDAELSDHSILTPEQEREFDEQIFGEMANYIEDLESQKIGQFNGEVSEVPSLRRNLACISESFKEMEGRYDHECEKALRAIDGYHSSPSRDGTAHSELWRVVKSGLCAIVEKKKESMSRLSITRHDKTLAALENLKQDNWNGLAAIAKRVSKKVSKEDIITDLNSNVQESVEKSQSASGNSSSSANKKSQGPGIFPDVAGFKR